jgi:hypothetical protein
VTRIVCFKGDIAGRSGDEIVRRARGRNEEEKKKKERKRMNEKGGVKKGQKKRVESKERGREDSGRGEDRQDQKRLPLSRLQFHRNVVSLSVMLCQRGYIHTNDNNRLCLRRKYTVHTCAFFLLNWSI